MPVFNQSSPLDRLKKKPVQPAGSVLSGLNATPPQPPVSGLQPFQTQPQQQPAPGVLDATQPPPPIQGQPPVTREGVVAPAAPAPAPTQPQPAPTGLVPDPIVTPEQQPDANILSTLDPELQALIEKNIQGFASGEAFAAQKAASSEAFARAAGQVRAAAGGAAGGLIGQGAAVTAQQDTEQAILSAVGQKGLQDALAQQDMIMKGTGMAVDLAKMNTAQQNFLSELDFKFTGLNAQNQQFFANLTSQEKMFLENLNSQEGLLAMQLKSNEKIQADKNWLAQQGIDLNSAQLYGYEDADGNWVMGSLQLQSLAFENSMKTQAGQSFANYITANKNTNIDDPAVMQLGQALWESLGNKGPVPKDWVEARIESVRDPSLTNPILGMKSMLDEAVTSGDMTQEEADLAWAGFKDMMFNLEQWEIGPDGIPVKKDSGDDDDPDKTTKELFTDWADKNIPHEFIDSVTQQDWVDAGKPDTWEDFIEATKTGPDTTGPDTTGPDTTPTKPIFDEKTGTMAMTDDDINKIIGQINDGFGPTINKYGASGPLNDVFANGESAKTKGIEGLTNSINANRGRIIKLSDGRSVVVVGNPVKSRPPNFMQFEVYDPKTGEKETIQI